MNYWYITYFASIIGAFCLWIFISYMEWDEVTRRDALKAFVFSIIPIWNSGVALVWLVFAYDHVSEKIRTNRRIINWLNTPIFKNESSST